MRVETTVGGPLYSLKVWPDGQPEPAAWTLQEQLDNTELTHGSMLMLAHHVDASFGPLVVTPLPSGRAERLRPRAAALRRAPARQPQRQHARDDEPASEA